MAATIPLDLRELIFSYERLLTGLEANDEHDRHRPVKMALRQEISELRAQLIQNLIKAGATEQEANQAASGE